MRFHIHTPEELIDFLEDRIEKLKAESRLTQRKSDINYIGGRINGLQESIDYVKEHIKTLADDAASAQLAEAQPLAE